MGRKSKFSKEQKIEICRNFSENSYFGMMRFFSKGYIIKYKDLKEIDKNMPELSTEEAQEVEIQIKYEGYIKLEEAQVEKFKKLEKRKLPHDLDYSTLKGLRLEARQKLNKIKPESVGQASRISGVSPADISVLLIYLEQVKNKGGK